MKMCNKPTGKPAVIYNQDDLFDYAQLGGSVESLFDEEIKGGHQIVVIQEAVNAPPTVRMVLETMEDFKRCMDSRLKTLHQLAKIFGKT
jgi:hypothetical protein